MSLSLRSVLPQSSTLAGLAAAPACAAPFCPRPPTLWQRWWARNEGIWLDGQWHCSLDCFQAGLFRRLQRAAVAGPRRRPRLNHLPLGLLLLSQGAITDRQLRQALAEQRAAKQGRLGEWLVRMGAVNEQQVTAALAVQQGCAVFAAKCPQVLPDQLHWPETLVHSYRAAPVFYNRAQASLFVGFLDQVDHAFLLTVEHMLQCRTEPCIVPPQVYERHLEVQAMWREAGTIVIHQRLSAEEMTGTVGNYAQQVRAERCLLTACDDHLWIRLLRVTGGHVDLLFRLPAMQATAAGGLV